MVVNTYSNYSNIWGIELINEPRGDTNLTSLQAWYTQAYAALRQVVPTWHIVMHDSFRPESWVGFMNDTTQYTNVTLDTHVYYVFSVPLVEQTLPQKIQDACATAAQIDFMECEELPTITGEWSMAVNDCALWLDGMEQPTRANASGISCDNRPYDSFYIQYAQSQLWAWERGHGWMFWNFKNELEDDWSYFKAVERGWFPANASDIPTFIANACNASDLYYNLTTITTPSLIKTEFLA